MSELWVDRQIDRIYRLVRIIYIKIDRIER